MADYSKIQTLSNGALRSVDLQSNSLVVGSIKIGTSSPTELTKSALDSLLLISSDLASTAISKGASLVGINGSFANFTAGSTVQSALEGINAQLAATSGVFSDSRFVIHDNVDATANFVFDASAIPTGTSRTLKMANFNVDLSKLLNQDGSIKITGILEPATTDATDFGSASKRFKDIYSTNVYADKFANSIGEFSAGGLSSVINHALDLFTANSGGLASGAITLTTGTSSLTRGNIVLSGLNVDVSSTKIINLAPGVAGTDAVNKNQLDAAVSGGGQVKISATDTTSEYLGASLTVSSELTKTIVNGSANEQLNLSISALGVTNSMLAGSIDHSKMVALTADKALISDASGIVSASSVSNVELGYVSGVTSAIQTQLNAKVDENAAITGATKTKITYDSKGLVTSGADATTADIADSSNKRYVTDADLVDIGNLSGTNTGDQTITLTGDITGSGTGSFATTIGASKVVNSMVASGIDAVKISSGVVDNTEFDYLNGVTSSIQTQLDAKVAKSGSSMSSAANIVFSGGGEILGLPSTPSAAGAAASKAYVDAVALGLAPKKAVRVATLVAETLSNLINGYSVDGVSLVTGDRILIKDQAAPAENGIYVVQATNPPVRSTDFDEVSPIDEINGAWVPVQFGTQAGRIFVQYGVVATVNTSAITFEFYNPLESLIGGDMITNSGSTFSVDLASGSGLESSNPGNANGQLQIKLDAATLSKSASGLKVSTAGISALELASNSVETAKILNANVTLAKLASDSVDETKIVSTSFDVAGALTGGSATKIKVNVDNSTIEIATNALRIKALGITNSHISASAGIVYSKLSIAAGDIVYSKLTLTDSIVNSDINSAAAIAYSKLNLSASIVNADIASGAAIAYSKLALSNSIVAGDLTAASVTKAKIASDVFDQATIVGGTGTSASVSSSPALKVYGETCGEGFSATTVYAVRYAQNAETAGTFYKADINAATNDNFWVNGLILTVGALVATDPMPVIVKSGLFTYPAGGLSPGKAVYLDAAGALTVTAPTAVSTAVFKIGIAKSASVIDVSLQMVGVN